MLLDWPRLVIGLVLAWAPAGDDPTPEKPSPLGPPPIPSPAPPVEVAGDAPKFVTNTDSEPEPELSRRVQELEEANRRLEDRLNMLMDRHERLLERIEREPEGDHPRDDLRRAGAQDDSPPSLGDPIPPPPDLSGPSFFDPFDLPSLPPVVEQPDLPPIFESGLTPELGALDANPREREEIQPLPSFPPLSSLVSGPEELPQFGPMLRWIGTLPRAASGVILAPAGEIPWIATPVGRLFPGMARLGLEPSESIRDDLPELFPRLDRDRTDRSIFGYRFPTDLAGVPSEDYGGTPRDDLPELYPQVERPNVSSPYRVGYDRGFFIKPVDPEETPFEFRFGGRVQFRQITFARSRDFWVNSAGTVLPIVNRNDFELERGRLTFAGFVLDPKLQYYMNINGSTDLNHNLQFIDYWINYRFGPAFNLFAGKAYVPGSREYLDGSARTRFVDRSMTTTFFRPSRSVGIWAIGEPALGLYYRAMIANAFRAPDLSFEEIDRDYVFAVSTWWDPLNNFGVGVPDLEWHESPAFRVGQSSSFSRQGKRLAFAFPSGEIDFVRLTDGTPLTLPNAIAPDRTVDQFDLYLLAADFAFKYRGLGINGEYYMQWIENMQANGPLPFTSLMSHGYYLEAGYFVIPKRLEVGGRVSQIFGSYGNAGEYAGAVTWYIRGNHNWKLMFDATRVLNTPTSNFNTNYQAGDTGVMFRTQIQVAF